MVPEEFYVEQTLHGYSNGHRLLQASLALSEQDNKKMMVLSDLSGNEFVKGFEKYFTGYSLDDNRIVLACTWYAEEMKRPGCVWTHSLIFDVRDLFLLEIDIVSIIGAFEKPSVDSDFSYYGNALKIKKSNKENLDETNLKYLIWCIWGNKKPLVIYDDNSVDYEKEIVFLFLTQHDLVGEDFSFCTGSVSLRGYEGRILQLQVVPNKISRSKLSVGEKTYEAKNKNVIKNFPLWVDKMFDNLKIDHMKKYRKFVSGFSKEYKQPVYLSAFMKLYVGSSADRQRANLLSLLKMASAIFEDKKKICNEIIALYGKGFFSKWCIEENYNETINFLLDNMWLDISSIDFGGMLKRGFISDYEGSKRLFRNIMRREESSITEILLKKYADIVPENQFVDFTELEYDCCSTLISIKNEFALCQEVWKRSKGYQQGIVRCLSPQNDSLDKKIIETVLQASEYDLADELFKIYGNECIQLYWTYLLTYQTCKKVNGIIDIIKYDTKNGVKFILDNLSERETLLFLLNILDPYDKVMLKLEKNDINKIFNTVMDQECTGREKVVLARFLLPFCIIGDYMVEDEIAKFVFDVVNGLLATQIFPENEWDKLEKILPEVAYYNRWDRCKTLRKGFCKKGYLFIEKDKKEVLPDYLL